MSSGPIHSVVIVGGGQAAVEAAVTLRKKSFAGEVTLLCAEPCPPYQRPPLSKQLLAGKIEPVAIALRATAFFERQEITLHLGSRATHIDRVRKTVHTQDGERLPYDRLLIATGATVRRLDLAGAQLEGVHYLRRLEDCLALRSQLQDGARLVIIGGGYIGMEVAATARGLGCEVTVLEMAPRIMARQVAPEISALFEVQHRAQGVVVRCAAQVEKLIGRRHIEAVQVDGETLATDILVVGVGVLPEVGWLDGSGLSRADGIEVDACCRSVDEAVYAAGDVALQARGNGIALRVESVQNANFQGRTAALAILDEPPPAEEVPWFWSNQYDLRLQIAGFPGPADRSVARYYDSGMAVFFLDAADRMSAVQCVSRPRDFMLGKKLIARAQRVDPQHLSDANYPLQELLQ